MRVNNCKSSIKLLNEHGVPVTINNHGKHFIIKATRDNDLAVYMPGWADYWPNRKGRSGPGWFIIRDTLQRGRGVHDLISLWTKHMQEKST